MRQCRQCPTLLIRPSPVIEGGTIIGKPFEMTAVFIF